MNYEERLERAVIDCNLPFTPSALQLEDVLQAASCDRFLFAYSVGGGKTLCATLVGMVWDSDHNIIIMPPILLPQWQRWLAKVGLTNVKLFHGPRRTPRDLDAKWVVMSHAMFRDSFDMIEYIYRGKDVALFIDEAQVLKSVKSVTYRKVSKFIQPDRKLVMMTATPTSKPEDTFTYINLKTPNVYRSWGHWENVHVGERDHFKAIVSYRNLDMLADNFALKSAKRDKKELFGDTLEPIMQELPYRLSAPHQKLYAKLVDEQLLLLPDSTKIDATNSQKLHHALQQIVVNYARYSGVETDRSASYDIVDQIIDEVNPMQQGNSKLVIWVWYRQTAAALLRYLQDKHGAASTVAAYGGANSVASVDRIMFDDTCRIGVFHPASVGAGLELQFVCSEMLILEASTSPIYMRQAIGRVDRPGQKVRPTIRLAQAQGTVQTRLFQKLLDNDELTSRVELSKDSLRNQLLGLDCVSDMP